MRPGNGKTGWGGGYEAERDVEPSRGESMSKPVIQLHTIEQWMATDPSIRSVVLQNIKLKDRLYKYLYSLNEKKQQITEPKYVRCSKCSDSEHPGYLLMEPRYDGIHPSTLANPCLKKTYFEMVGVEKRERIEPRLRLIFDLGHAVHHMFQTYGLNGAWGPTYQHEVEVSEDFQPIAKALMLEGHADAENVLLIDDIPGSPYSYEVGLVHEYKTINSDAFGKLTRPKPEHKQQAMVYSAALNRPVVVYLYMSKNDQNLADFPVAFEPDLWRNLEGKAQLLVDHYNRQTSPKGEVGYNCRDCAFQYACDDHKAAQAARR